MEKYNGSWELVEKDGANFDKYMAEIGVGWIKRKVGKTLSRTITIKVVGGDSIELKSVSTLKTIERTVKIGESCSGFKMRCKI